MEQDPYKHEYSLWKLEDERFNKSINTILYERRNALREGNSKKKHLRKDLNELESLSKTMEKISMSVLLSNSTKTNKTYREITFPL